MLLIQKDDSKSNFIINLYKENKIIFEKTTLISNNLKYVICYFSSEDYYYVYIYNYIDNITYSCVNFKKLSNSTLRYFNMQKDDTYDDWFKNSFHCLSHIVGYK